MTKVLAAVVVAILWAAVAGAAMLDASLLSNGNLAAAQTGAAPFASTNFLRVARYKNRTLTVTLTNTAGTATAQLEVNCNGTATAPGWALVAGSSSALSATPTALSVVYPACDYRVNVTACAGCSVNADFWVGPEIQ